MHPRHAFAALLLSSASPLAYGGSDPASLLQAFCAALQSQNTEAALQLWSETGELIDEGGETVHGKDALRRYIKQNPRWLHLADIGSIQASGYSVRWVHQNEDDPYRSLRVAPVFTQAALRVRGGKIEQLVLHVPESEIARIEKACGTRPVMIGSRTCREHVERARAHGSNADGLIPAR